MPTAVREAKILRILRVRVFDKPGYLGRLASRLGELGANIGEISIVAQGPDFLMREISLQLDDETHLAHVVDGLKALESVEVEAIIDPVELAHQGGKIAMKSRFPLDSIAEMRKIYTPGVAQICRLIQKDITASRTYTSIGNSVAVVTNGTAILGLGNIGPVAGMPVMEGKSVLYEQLVGISAIPILIESTDVDTIVETVKNIATTFGAIHLEDIAAPACFEVEERLQAELPIPVLHDDQHATAVVTLAALQTITQRNLLHLVDCKVGIIGLGAAGAGIAQLLRSYGVKIVCGADLRADAMQRLADNGGEPMSLAEIMSNCDVVVATTGVPGLIKPSMIRPGHVILALSNPDPEILPEVALANGAIFAADGRTINNALSFPGLFRGALRAHASRFTDEMKLAAASAICGQTKMDSIVPSILDREVHAAVADAVARAALS
ncbi:MAG: NAD(P)-binding domain-containing protein [Cyanobacteria bacterium REEB67]|nr:NAD(P)-binding domain-containing protein [Cyanobacteria bacterium REEB67]